MNNPQKTTVGEVGDLVIDHKDKTLFGIVLMVDNDAIKVSWNKDHGIYWILQKTVRMLK